MELAEINNEGLREMARLQHRRGDDYSTYEEWENKLQDEYLDYGQQIQDAYLDSAS